MVVDRIRKKGAFQPGKEYTADAKLERVTWEDDKSNFAICKFKGVESRLEFTAKGVLFPRVVGVIYRLTGTFQWNKQYGQNQFLIKKFEYTNERTTEGVANYLVSEAPGIGPKRAEDIAYILGADALEKIIADPTVLSLVPGVSKKQGVRLREWLVSEKKVMSLRSKLYDIGLTQSQVGKFISHFGENAAEKVKEDCFSLVNVDGIGFLTVCKIADLLGIPPLNPQRIREGIKYTMKQRMQAGGHVCVGWHELVVESTKILAIPKNNVIEQIEFLIERGELVAGDDDPVKFTKHVELFQEVRGDGREKVNEEEGSEGRSAETDDNRQLSEAGGSHVSN